jgi:antitoxin component YwqK of YwqJK toxin-antitoxin module
MAFVRSGTAAVAALASFFLFANAQAGPTYFASNETGMAFEEIPSFRLRDEPFYLVAESGPGTELLVLKNSQGEELKRWDYTIGANGRASRVEYSVAGILESIESYGPKGTLLSEDHYAAGQLVERVEHRFEGDRLVASEARTSTGELLYADSYRYSLEGSLREISREYPDKRIVSAGMEGRNGRLARSWQRVGDAVDLLAYDRSGAVIGREKWGIDEPRYVEERIAAKADAPGRDLVEDLTRGIRIEREYDRGGKLAREKSFQGKRMVSETSYAYSADGRLESKTLRAGGRTEEHTYAYGKGDSLLYEEERLDGVIQKKYLYEDAATVWTEYYFSGLLSVRVKSVDGRKKTEEIVSGGTVVRTRTFK